MATIKLQNGKVVINNGMVSCNCCIDCTTCDLENDAAGCTEDYTQAFSKVVTSGTDCNGKIVTKDLECYECVDCIYPEEEWLPLPSDICEGVIFEQTNSSGYAPQCEGCAPGPNPDGSIPCGDKYRENTGTKTGCATCSDCNLESDPLACTNQPDKIAVETTIQAGSSCNGKEVGEDLVCYDCLTCNRDNYPWTPDEAEVCNGVLFIQTRDGDYPGCTQTRDATGTKTCEATCEDCNLESSQGDCSSQPDKAGISKIIQAGSSCNDKNVIDDLECYECVTCNRDNYPWTPDEAEVCNGVLFIQTRDGDYPECTQTRDATGTKTCELKMPISVYKVGGLSISRINGGVSYPCIGCGYVLQGQITAESGAGSSVNITCAVGNEYNSREGVGVDAEGTVLTYRNSTTQNLTITYQNCLDGIFDPTTNWCGY